MTSSRRINLVSVICPSQAQLRWPTLLIFAICLILSSKVAKGQSYLQADGSPTFTTKLPVENGWIDASNGRLHLEIPIAASPQRANKSYYLAQVYDSNIWTTGANRVWQPTNGGWKTMDSSLGTLSYASHYSSSCAEWNGPKWLIYNSWTFTGPDGTLHSFPVTVWENLTQGFCSGNDTPTALAFATDASGYYISITDYYDATVYGPDGTQYAYNYGEGSIGGEDSNGNRLGPIVGTVSPSVNGNTTTYTVTNEQSAPGGTSTYTVTTATIAAKTNFGQANVTECTTSCTVTVVRSITLADGTQYTFKYDCDKTVDSTDCSSPSGQSAYYGLLTSMTLPTGGTTSITYSWTNFTDAQGSKYNWISSRTTPDGTWRYSQSVIGTPCGGGQVDCQQTFTVLKPSNDNVVYTFALNGGAWRNQIQTYTGSISSSNLVSTESDCWNFVTITNGVCTYNTTTGGGATGVTKEAETTTLSIPGGTTINATTQYAYDGYGNTTKIQENKYYTGTLPATADRTTNITYLGTTPYFNANIVNLPTKVAVTDSSGTLVSQTVYAYDSSTLVSATGMAGHDDNNYGTSNTVRGNLTQVQRFITTSAYVTTAMTYDMTGQMRTSSDTNGNVTTYAYTDSYYTDPGDGQTLSTKTVSPATNLFPTTITYPTVNSVTLKKIFGYYWGTGQIAVSTDENSNSTYFHFHDPLNRPTSTALPNGGWTVLNYNSTDTQVDIYTGTTNTTASNTCTACRHDQTVLDGLGRVTSNSLVNDPDGETYVATTYDANGRVATVSNPYRSVSDPTYGVETPTYDGLDRNSQVKHADNNIAHTYYGANVGTGGGATSQLCLSSTYGLGYPVLFVDESGNRRQTWTDGFGRVIEADEPSSTGSLTVGTCYTFDLNNNLLKITSLGLTQTQKPTYTYDLLSRVTSRTLPESGATNFYYTTSGSALCSGNPVAVCRRTDARSITTTYAYDALNRLTSKNYSDGTPIASRYYDQVGYTNPLGRLTSIETNTGSTIFTAEWFGYDAVGNMISQVKYANGHYESLSYTYNLDGSVASVTYPGGRTVTKTETNAQRVSKVADTATGINYVTSPSSGAMYAPQGALAKALHGYVSGGFSGITESYSYNNRLQITGIEATSSAGAPLNLAYSFVTGNNGDIATQTNNVSSGRTQNYTYDALNRLLTAQAAATSGGDCWGQSFGNNGPPVTLAADALANLFYTSSIKCSSPSPQFTMNSSNDNQFTGTGIGYDTAGDMTADTAYSYTYDAENRIVSASGMSNGPYCYTYDENGFRVAKAHANGGSCTGTVTVDMLYWRSISGDTLAETDGTSSITNANYNEYIYFAGRRIGQSNPSSGNVYYYFADHLGSTRVVTTATGTPCFEDDYLPYGTENTPAGFTNTCSTRYRFTGYERDAETATGNSAGNDYAFARYYNSRLGRFMSADPLDGDIADPQTLNHYAYVRDNPIDFVDPLGMQGQPNLGCGLFLPSPVEGGSGSNALCGGENCLGSDSSCTSGHVPRKTPPGPARQPGKKKRLKVVSDCLDGNGRWIDYQLVNDDGTAVDGEFGVTEHVTDQQGGGTIRESTGYPNVFNDKLGGLLLVGSSTSHLQSFTIAPGRGSAGGTPVPIQYLNGAVYGSQGIYIKNIGGQYPQILVNGARAATTAPPGQKCPSDNQ